MTIRAKAYPRAGLAGNPSDAFFGKTIAFVFGDFAAEATLEESRDIEIEPASRDHSRFRSVDDLVQDVTRYGYYGGVRLIKAAIKRFGDHCRAHGIDLPRRNFTVRYTSDIPHRVGLAGSSAIITACLRGLMQFYEVRIRKPELANLVWSVETEELGIPAGLQDRVAQVYEGVVYMDFDRKHMEKKGWGRYERIDPSLLPPLYIAYRVDLSQGSEVLHQDLRARFERGDQDVLEAVDYWAKLAEKTHRMLLKGKGHKIGKMLDANFDRRCKVCRVGKGNRQMAAALRSTGASAKFTGSGGAFVGTYDGVDMFRELRAVMEPFHARVFKPTLVRPEDES